MPGAVCLFARRPALVQINLGRAPTIAYTNVCYQGRAHIGFFWKLTVLDTLPDDAVAGAFK
jgi:hypothetical protein